MMKLYCLLAHRHFKSFLVSISLPPVGLSHYLSSSLTGDVNDPELKHRVLRGGKIGKRRTTSIDLRDTENAIQSFMDQLDSDEDGG